MPFSTVTRPVKVGFFCLLLAGTAAGLFSFWQSASLSRAAASAPGARFVDVAKQAGVRHTLAIHARPPLTILETIGNGGALLDYNNDGNLDALVVDTKPALYKGDGRGGFVDVTHATGLDRISSGGSAKADLFLGCAVGDYDNDGDKDLYLSGYRTGVLLKNAAGRHWENVTTVAGLKPQPWGTSCGFADLNGDGLLDLFVANYVQFGPDPKKYVQRCPPTSCGPNRYEPERPALYRNLGGGRFMDVSPQSGVRSAAAGKGLGVAFADYDDDGDQDILVANDKMPADLFENDGRGRFLNRGVPSGVAWGLDGQDQAGMGTDWADYNNDGKLDAVIVNFGDEPKSVYRSDGHGAFTNVSQHTGIGPASLPYVAFGVKWLDYNNDGWQDLLIANGHVGRDVTPNPQSPYRQPMQAFRSLGAFSSGRGGRGEVRFADDSKALGSALQKPIVGRGLATGDFDNDGRVDALVVDDEGPVLLLRNASDGTAAAAKRNHWIGLRLQGDGKRSNRDALGARVMVRAGGRTQMREVHTAGSYLSASDSRLLLGLGSAARVDSITIRWPDGRTQTLRDLAAGEYHFIRQQQNKGK